MIQEQTLGGSFLDAAPYARSRMNAGVQPWHREQGTLSGSIVITETLQGDYEASFEDLISVGNITLGTGFTSESTIHRDRAMLNWWGLVDFGTSPSLDNDLGDFEIYLELPSDLYVASWMLDTVPVGTWLWNDSNGSYLYESVGWVVPFFDPDDNAANGGGPTRTNKLLMTWMFFDASTSTSVENIANFGVVNGALGFTLASGDRLTWMVQCPIEEA
jgi:hypothetical protein